MKCKKTIAIAAAAVAAATILTAGLYAQEKRDKKPPVREVLLTGKVVDLHCYMTQKFPSADRVKCTQECIRVGVPAALETVDGLVVIGKGPKGPARDIAPLALKNVELKGMLYERHGLRYIDVISAEAAKTGPSEEEEEDWDESEEEDS